MSRVAKGNYHRLKTKRWLEDLGYRVANLESSQRIVVPGDPPRVLFRKADLWGADLLARNAEKIVFIQVKANSGDIARGMRELSEGPWPPEVLRWVIHWPPRRRFADGPDIVEVP